MHYTDLLGGLGGGLLVDQGEWLGLREACLLLDEGDMLSLLFLGGSSCLLLVRDHMGRMHRCVLGGLWVNHRELLCLLVGCLLSCRLVDNSYLLSCSLVYWLLMHNSDLFLGSALLTRLRMNHRQLL